MDFEENHESGALLHRLKIQKRLNDIYNQPRFWFYRPIINIKIRYTDFEKILGKVLLNKNQLAQHKSKLKDILNEIRYLPFIGQGYKEAEESFKQFVDK
jgi:hypothetical protein